MSKSGFGNGVGDFGGGFGQLGRVNFVADDESFITDQHAAVVAHELTIGQTGGAGWTQAAIVPDEFARRHADASGFLAGQADDVLIVGLDGRVARREIVSDGGTQRISFFIHARRAALHGSGCAELERAEDGVHGVTANITKRAGAEIPPTPPDEREVNRIVWSL